jgi:hypothetical protein
MMHEKMIDTRRNRVDMETYVRYPTIFFETSMVLSHNLSDYAGYL